MVKLAGISPDELARYRRPAPFASRGGAILQPPVDPARPHQRGIPQPLYEAILAMKDEEVTARMSESTPPVKVEE